MSIELGSSDPREQAAAQFNSQMAQRRERERYSETANANGTTLSVAWDENNGQYVLSFDDLNLTMEQKQKFGISDSVILVGNKANSARSVLGAAVEMANRQPKGFVDEVALYRDLQTYIKRMGKNLIH